MPNDTIIEELLKKIHQIQLNADRQFWEEGLFPSFRYNKLIGYNRPDNSMFFSASIVFLLHTIKKYFPENSQILINEITESTINNYIDYKSIKDENVYNFYPTNPSKHFGNGFFFKHFKHFQLPHDADDTALVYLTSSFSKHEHLWLQNKLAEHSNGRSAKIKNTFQKYNHLKAYSTWFGDKMAIEFDVCVLCNILFAQKKAGLTLDKFGLDAWEYVKLSVLNDDYINYPFEISHNYAKTEIIAYHITRLISEYELTESDKIIKKLKVDLMKMLNKSNEFSMKNILISTSLARLKIKIQIQIPENLELGVAINYSFFLAGLITSYEIPILQKIAKMKLSHINWTCSGHNLALILENKVLLNI